MECFERGGGVPYSSYGRFHAVMAEQSDQTVLAGLLEHILPLVPGLPERLARGIDVLDVGCGSGRALARMAAAFPNSRFTGVDASARARSSTRASRRAARAREPALRAARRRGARSGRPLRPGHRLRRHPRPGGAGRRARERRRGAAARRGLPDAGHRRHRRRARGRGAPARDLPLHGVLPALHDRVAGGGRRRARRDVGRARGAAHAGRGRLRPRRGAGAPARPDQPLLRRAEGAAAL